MIACAPLYPSFGCSDFLYGDNDGKDIPQMMGETDRYDELTKWTNDQWVGLLNKYVPSPSSSSHFNQQLLTKFPRYIIDNSPVIVLGKPSASLPEKLEAEEKARIAAQKASLGEEGLAKKVKELEEAKKEHERPIPQEMLTSFPVPPVSSINWIPVKAAWNDPKKNLKSDSELQAHVEKDETDLPFFVGFNHAKVSLAFVCRFEFVLTVYNSQVLLQFRRFCLLWTSHRICYREFLLAALLRYGPLENPKNCCTVISRFI